MSEKEQQNNGFSLDWLVGGVLTKVGETLDRVTGRGWNPSSSLATSKLIEKLKFLLDEEAREAGSGRFAPHLITLKIQWNKFASDSDDDLEALRDELHAAAIDHINDKLYHTYAPIKIEIKNDYFTEGVKMIGSFGDFGREDDEAAINVTLPNIKIEPSEEGSRVSINLEETPGEEIDGPVYLASFEVNGRQIEKKLDFGSATRFSVGRVRENDLAIDHKSVSKVHASLVLNRENKLLLADTGSTNGTYVSGERISYGKAVDITGGRDLKFGSVNVELKAVAEPAVSPESIGPAEKETATPEPDRPLQSPPGTPVKDSASPPVKAEPANLGGPPDEPLKPPGKE